MKMQMIKDNDLNNLIAGGRASVPVDGDGPRPIPIDSGPISGPIRGNPENAGSRSPLDGRTGFEYSLAVRMRSDPIGY